MYSHGAVAGQKIISLLGKVGGADRQYNVLNGVTDISTELQYWLTELATSKDGVTSGVLVVEPGTYRIGTDVTVPAGVTVKMDGGEFSIDSGKTLTVNGTLDLTHGTVSGAGSLTFASGSSAQLPETRQCFDVSGGLTVTGLGVAVDIISAVSFGITGDGVTDDKATLQVAMTAAVGGKLLIPAGQNCYLSDVVTLPVDTELWMYRAKLTLQSGSDASEDMLYLNAGCKVFGGELDGNRTDGLSQHFGIRNYGSNIVIKDVYFHHHGFDGIYLRSQTGTTFENIIIDGCRFDTNYRNGISVVDDVQGVMISNCYFKTSPSTLFGVDVEPNAIATQHVSIENCMFDDASLQLRGGNVAIKGMAVTNNRFFNSSNAYLQIRKAVEAVVNGNSFYDGGTMKVANEDNNQQVDVSLEGNYIEGQSNSTKNLLNNGSFEYWTSGVPSGWTEAGTGSPAVDYSTILFGKKSCRINLSSQSSQLTQSISIKSSTTYTIVCYANSSYTSGNVQFIEVSDGTNTYQQAWGETSGVWERRTMVFTTDAAATTLTIKIGINSTNTVTDVSFDGVAVYEGVPTAEYIDEKRSSEFIARDYGVSGDGSTDEATALQAAMTASAGGTLVLDGKMLIILDSTVTLPANTTLIGNGATLRLKAGLSGSEDVLRTGAGCKVYGLEIDGNRTDQSTGQHFGLRPQGSHCYFEDVYSHDNSYDGVYLTGAYENIELKRCRLENNYRYGSVILSSLQNIRFMECRFEGNATQGALVQPATASTHITFQNCEMDDDNITLDGTSAAINQALLQGNKVYGSNAKVIIHHLVDAILAGNQISNGGTLEVNAVAGNLLATVDLVGNTLDSQASVINNLLNNGSFEKWNSATTPTGWTLSRTGGTQERSSTALFGKSSWHNSLSANTATIAQTISCEGDTVYTIGVRAKGTYTSGNIQFIEVSDGTNTYKCSWGATVVDWEKRVIVFKTDAGATNLTVTIGASSSSTTDLYFDGAFVYKGIASAEYAETDSILGGVATLDFGSIAAGATAELTVAVPGATTSDTIMLGPPSGIEAGLGWFGYVSSANTVTVRIHNTTGGAIDPASAEWKVAVVPIS